MIYLDHNATTPVDERVFEAMAPFLQAFYGNPSSLYRLGRLSSSALETAREQVADLIGAHPTQVVFTSGGTEANNLALNCIAKGSSVAISAIEHPSITEPVAARSSYFSRVDRIAVDENGLIKRSALEALELKKGDFVSLMLANNETGVIQPVAAMAERLKSQGVTVHSDAVQALGKTPFSFDELNVDLLSLSSHKIYGPKGCGALVLRKDLDLQPMIFGGGQEHGVRAGTENAPAIVGFGKAAELAKAEFDLRSEKLLLLRRRLESELLSLPGVRIFSLNAERLPNTVQMAMPGVDGEMLLMQLDRLQIAVSSGSACAAGGGKASPVLTAMGVDDDTAKSAIRISLGKDNTARQIDEFVAALKHIVNF